MRLKRILLVLLVSTWANYSAASPWPVGVNDGAPTLTNMPISISVLENDIGNNLIISAVNETSVAWGKITISADKKTLNYTPYKDYAGGDEFWYELKDDEGRTNAANVQVSVSREAGLPDWPVAVTDTVTANYDTVAKFKVLANDIGAGLKLVEVNEWSTNQGKAWISGYNEISYQQYGEARGERQDEFWYVMVDRWGRRNAAKVIVSLKEATYTPWPVATPDFAEAKNGLRVVIRVLENDSGTGLKLEESNPSTAKGGQTEIMGTYIRYTPPAGFSGEDSFWYSLADDEDRTNSTEVKVQVSANTEKSVVEFCGNTYETDGTKAGTRLTSLLPASPVTYPSTAIPPTGVSGELGVIQGRRYYVETAGSQQTLFMDFNGSVSEVSSVDSDLQTTAMGTYKGVFYYVEAGRYLLAHDGNKLTTLGDLLLTLGAGNWYISAYDHSAVEDPERYVNTVRLEEGAGDALYFSINNTITPSDGLLLRERVTYLRISDDLDWRPVKVQEVIPFHSDTFNREESVRALQFFNGLDYYVQTLSMTQTPSPETNVYTIKQRDHYYFVKGIDADVTAITEDRGRLFIATKASTTSIISQNIDNIATLFVVDNVTDEYVQLATCE